MTETQMSSCPGREGCMGGGGGMVSNEISRSLLGTGETDLNWKAQGHLKDPVLRPKGLWPVLTGPDFLIFSREYKKT